MYRTYDVYCLYISHGLQIPYQTLTLTASLISLVSIAWIPIPRCLYARRIALCGSEPVLSCMSVPPRSLWPFMCPESERSCLFHESRRLPHFYMLSRLSESHRYLTPRGAGLVGLRGTRVHPNRSRCMRRWRWRLLLLLLQRLGAWPPCVFRLDMLSPAVPRGPHDHPDAHIGPDELLPGVGQYDRAIRTD